MSGEVKTVLVLGATGGIGGAATEALLSHGWQVKALVRNREKAAAGWSSVAGTPKWLVGDAMTREDVVGAARGVQAIVHAVNPPGYRNWEKLVLPMIDNTIAAARAADGARVVLPGTLYNFDPNETPLLDEDSPQRPKTRKGLIRKELEQRLEMAEDIPSLIIRAGDFFGPQARSSWFAQALVRPGGTVKHIVNPGAAGVGHSWAYLPDLAETFARLMEAGARLRRFERVQFEGYWDADGGGMAAMIRSVLGREIPERRFPWWTMRLAAPFGGFPREVLEIRPYWRAPVRLDNSRLVSLLGEEPRTPPADALRATLGVMKAV